MSKYYKQETGMNARYMIHASLLSLETPNSVFVIFLIIAVLVCLNYFDIKAQKKSHDNVKSDGSKEIDIASQIDSFFHELRNVQNDYFRECKLVDLKNTYKDLYTKVSSYKENNRANDPAIEFIQNYENLETTRETRNRKYVSDQLQECSSYFDTILDKPLDEQQRIAIVTDDDNNMVLAGAGCGKTTTILGKVKYLVEKKGFHPGDILLLSFTDHAATQLATKLKKILAGEVRASTFHALGLDIIRMANNSTPKVFDVKSTKGLITKILKELPFSETFFFQKYLEFILHYMKAQPSSVSNNLTSSSTYPTLKSTSTAPEFVKSLEELSIANFLFINGVKYEYEANYPFDPMNSGRKQYTPDFFLPDHNLYLEHFGLSETGRAPWLSDPKEEIEYLNGVKWKREIHQANNTKLIETYSYYNRDGKLLEKLEELLISNGVKLSPPSSTKGFIKNALKSFDSAQVDSFVSLLSTFIGLFKSGGYEIQHFHDLRMTKLNDSDALSEVRKVLFLGLAESVYKKYQENLDRQHSIDFSDMINKASKLIENNKVILDFRYIIIDEFQDISKSWYRLFIAIRNQTGSRTMVVGDDWQSIYRFARSDVTLFTGFRNNPGAQKPLPIEHTYRCPKEIAEVSQHFIKKNPIQLSKNLESSRSLAYPIKIFFFNTRFADAFNAALKEVASKIGQNETLLLLGRNNKDIKMITREVGGSFNSSTKKYTNPDYPNLNIKFLTVHTAKGLEADYVFLINLQDHMIGFPNQMTDDPILSLVLSSPDGYPYSEERRLFYVALTRTKNDCYLITPVNSSSSFVKELLADWPDKSMIQTREFTDSGLYPCPRCKAGELKFSSDGKNGLYLCSNSPICNFSIPYECLPSKVVACEKCGGFMYIWKREDEESFWTCSNYPVCTNTHDLDEIVAEFDIDSLPF
jgi:DNA helicase-4